MRLLEEVRAMFIIFGLEDIHNNYSIIKYIIRYKKLYINQASF